jgi:phosphatidyl-myo-inositol dimannoside synthase
METLSAGVWRSIQAARPDAILIAHSGTNKALIWWFPQTLLRLIGLVVRGRIEVVVAGDALTYAVITPLLRAARLRHATMIMGLDVTYQNRLYRTIVHPLLRRSSQVIAISAATAEKAHAFGVPADRVAVLRLGVQAVEVTATDRAHTRDAMRQRLRLPDSDTVLLTLGRLVRRKGVRWFVESVLPGLPPNVQYIVAGQGPEADAILQAANSAGVAARVHLVGRVSDAEREELMIGADLFIQPNIAVPGDMEGFGLVTIEAAMRGTPVLAADLEGIKDAVVDGRTGILLPPAQPAIWLAELNVLTTNPESLAEIGLNFQSEARVLYGEDAMGRALCGQLGITPAVAGPVGS